MSINGNWYELESYGDWTWVDPDDWTQGMIFDLNAEDLGFTNDTPVSSWASVSSEMVFTQSNATKQPVFKTSVTGSNGKKAVSFDASNDGMDGPAFPVNYPALTLASVIIPRSSSQNLRVFSGHQSRDFFIHNSRANYCSNNGYIAAPITAATLNVPSVAMVTLSGTEGRAYKNNSDVTTDSSKGALINRVHLGASTLSNNPAETLGADALRLIERSRVLNSTAKAAFQAAMAADYAIS